MDIGNLVARAKGIIFNPKTVWPVAAEEPDSIRGLYLGYIVILAALPAVASFIKGSLIGYSAFGVTLRAPVGMGIAGMIVRYVLSLAVIFVVALIIDALADTFQGQKSQMQALKTIAYAWTAAWIAGIAVIIPWIGWLIALAGAIYSVYLLYIGLPVTMKCPKDKAAGYTALTVVISVVLSWIVGLIAAAVIGTTAMTGGASSMAISAGGTGDNVTLDPNSKLGKLEAWGNRVDKANKQLETARESGDAKAQQKAMNQMMGVALGGNGAVQAIDPGELKALLPASIAGREASDISADHTMVMGIDTSQAQASYRDSRGRMITLGIEDAGTTKGLLGVAAGMMPEQEHDTAHGYDKTWTQNGRIIHAQWNDQMKSGNYSITIASRFTVTASGNADSIDQLKDAVASVDLGRLEAMKNQGTSAE